MEVAFSDARPLDRERVVEESVEALTMAGILKNDERIELVHTQEIIPAYVIYDLEHSANVDVIRSWLAEHEIASQAVSANGSTSTWITR